MSHEALPIDIPSFTRALESLPVDALHTKAAEIQNSISHLRSSNEQMLPFADEGDQDCKDAMFENLVVIGRMNERINLLRAEAEKRGTKLHGVEADDMLDGRGVLVNGNVTSTDTSVGMQSLHQESVSNTTSLDAEQNRQESATADDDHQPDEEGMHL